MGRIKSPMDLERKIQKILETKADFNMKIVLTRQMGQECLFVCHVILIISNWLSGIGLQFKRI